MSINITNTNEREGGNESGSDLGLDKNSAQPPSGIPAFPDVATIARLANEFFAALPLNPQAETSGTPDVPSVRTFLAPSDVSSAYSQRPDPFATDCVFSTDGGDVLFSQCARCSNYNRFPRHSVSDPFERGGTAGDPGIIGGRDRDCSGIPRHIAAGSRNATDCLRRGDLAALGSSDFASHNRSLLGSGGSSHSVFAANFASRRH